MSAPHRLRVAGDLIALERGADELLLASGRDVRPLYVRRGKGYIQALLEVVSRLARYDAIAAAFPEDRGLLDALIGHGILVDIGRENTDLPSCGTTSSREPRNADTVSLYLLVAQSCNMRCGYCLDGARTYRTSEHPRMPSEVAFRSVDACLDRLAPGNSLEVVFFGGEPLLNWQLVKGVIAYCEETAKKQYAGRSIAYHITSNLSFLPRDLIAWARRYGITFLCDVDGPAPVHDRCRPFANGRPSFDAITANITRLVDAGLHVALRATVTAANQDCLLETARLHKSLGGRSSAFVPVNTINSDGEMLAEPWLPAPDRVMAGMEEVYRARVWEERALHPFCLYAPRLQPGTHTVFGCGAPCGTMVVVDVKGDVYPCHYLVGMPPFHLGNVLTGTYPDDEALGRLGASLHVDRMDDCKSCAWRYLCGGGCPLGHLAVMGDDAASVGSGLQAGTSARTYWKRMTCDYTKRLIELVLWRRAEEAV